MQPTSEQIERVVREVLAEMQRAPASRAVLVPGPKPETPSACQAKPSAPDQDGVLVLSAQLITLAEVFDRLPGKRRVVVRPGTVVTPAVRDALRQRNVALEFATQAIPHNDAAMRLLLIAVGTRFDVQSLAAGLDGKGPKVECHLRDCLLEAVDLLAAELAGHDALGVLLTPHTAAALCLANRRSGVRAILGGELRNLPGDAAAVGANALIVDPKTTGSYQVRQMIESFGAGGVRPCPKVFIQQLS
ncbi:MAG: hypothetical protein JXB10_16110 [Pirellulales bacterium]|nr:hypothetical protein [Pirellulales bacterium]